MADKKSSAKREPQGEGSAKREPLCEARRVEFVAEDVKSVSLNKAGGSSTNFRFTILMVDGSSVVMSLRTVGDNEANARQAAELLDSVAKSSKTVKETTLKFL